MKPKRILAAAAIMLAFSPLHAVFYESELNADDPNYVDNLERALKEYVGGKRKPEDYIPSHNRAFELALYYAGYPREVFLKIDYY
ncbi:MAG: hypothetical protein IJI37_02735, partial [Opitutales bacterium]|nr:hypothetical protein [Opitutales bacterium]